MLKRSTVSTKLAPAALGPYSQAMLVDKTLYISGQLGIDPRSGLLVEGIQQQTRLALENLEMVLKAAKGSLRDVVKTTVLLKSMSDFDKVNAIYAKFFTENEPARMAFQVAKLPKDGLIEIEAVAVIGVMTAGSVYQYK